jgi:ABC-2 type transport system permease protein
MFKILRKELKAFLKDKRAVMLTFLLPTILITVFALAFGGDNGNGIREIPLLVCDQDKTDLSIKTINDIDSVKMLYVIPCTYDSAIDLIKRGKRTAVFILRKGLSDSVKAMKHLPWELQYDAARAQETGIIQSLLTRALYGSVGKIITRIAIEKNITTMFPLIDTVARNNIVARFTGNSGGSTIQSNMKLNTTSVISAKVGNVGLVQAVAGTAVMMLLFSLSGMGGGLLDEKENGTLKRLLYSPIHPAQILLGKMASAIIVASCQLTFMFGFATVVFHLQISDKIPALAIMILSTAIACSGFGVFLATMARSRQQLQGMSTLIILTMSVIGGSMVPSFLMPQWMQNLSVISINYWSIQGFYDILWRDLPIGGIFLSKVAVLVSVGVILTLLAFRFFRKNVLAID